MWSIALTGSWNSIEQIYCKLENTSQRVCVHVNVYCYLMWISRVKLCIDNQCLVQIFCSVGDLVPTRDRHWSIEKFDSCWWRLNFALTLIDNQIQRLPAAFNAFSDVRHSINLIWLVVTSSFFASPIRSFLSLPLAWEAPLLIWYMWEKTLNIKCMWKRKRN